MIGWLFRRGRDSPPAPRITDKSLGGEQGISSLTEIPVIVDDTGSYISTWSYVKNGESEGWLQYDSVYREGDTVYLRYIFTAPS